MPSIIEESVLDYILGVPSEQNFEWELTSPTCEESRTAFSMGTNDRSEGNIANRNDTYSVVSENFEGLTVSYDEENLGINMLEKECASLRNEILNIHRVVELEHSEKVEALERISGVLVCLRKNQDLLLTQLKSVKEGISQIISEAKMENEKSFLEMRTMQEREMSTKIYEMESEWKQKFDSLNDYWEQKFAGLERKIEREISTRRNKQFGEGVVQVVRKAPLLEKMAGRDCSKKKIRNWIEQAKSLAKYFCLSGRDAVEHVKCSLVEPALTRIKHADPESLDEMEEKLLEAYVQNKDELDRKKEFWCAEQKANEDIWEFVDRINDLDEEVNKGEIACKEREIMKCMIFEKGLIDRRVAKELRENIDDGKIVKLEVAGKYVKERSVEIRQVSRRNERINSELGKGKARCWKCGQIGHMAFSCHNFNETKEERNEMHSNHRYSKDSRVATKFEGNCWACGEVGHPFFKCRNETFRQDRPRMNESAVVREIAATNENDPEN